MKKKIRLLGVCIFLLGVLVFAGCGREEQKQADYKGTWTVSEGTTNGVSLTAEQLTQTLGPITMTVEDDGKVTKKQGLGLDENGKWTATETGILISDLDDTNSIAFHYVDGKLTGTLKGIDITMQK